MNNNNTNININEDIYNKFYSTLLVEIKKVIKRFQWRKAFRKYRANNKEKVNETQKKTNFNYYHNKNDFRSKKIDYSKKYSKIRYENDIEYRLKKQQQSIDYYFKNIESIKHKAKTKYEIMKNKSDSTVEINSNVILSQ